MSLKKHIINVVHLDKKQNDISNWMSLHFQFTYSLFILVFFFAILIVIPRVHAENRIQPVLTKMGSFVDQAGRQNIVGVVDNFGNTSQPIESFSKRQK